MPRVCFVISPPHPRLSHPSLLHITCSFHCRVLHTGCIITPFGAFPFSQCSVQSSTTSTSSRFLTYNTQCFASFQPLFTHASSCVTLLRCASVAASRRRPQAPTQSPGPRCTKLSQTAAVGHTWWVPDVPSVTGQAPVALCQLVAGAGVTPGSCGVCYSRDGASALCCCCCCWPWCLPPRHPQRSETTARPRCAQGAADRGLAWRRRRRRGAVQWPSRARI